MGARAGPGRGGRGPGLGCRELPALPGGALSPAGTGPAREGGGRWSSCSRKALPALPALLPALLPPALPALLPAAPRPQPAAEAGAEGPARPRPAGQPGQSGAADARVLQSTQPPGEGAKDQHPGCPAASQQLLRAPAQRGEVGGTGAGGPQTHLCSNGRVSGSAGAWPAPALLPAGSGSAQTPPGAGRGAQERPAGAAARILHDLG